MSRTDEHEWASQTLAELATDLASLNQEIEVEFLRVGAKLIESIAMVNLMSAAWTTLASLISGDCGMRASQALTGVLTLSGEMKTRTEEGGRQLGKMHQEAGRLGQSLSEFSKTVSAFHSLGMLTRAETRRLKDLGLDLSGLADDIRFLALNVRSKVEKALETVGELTPRIESALAEVAALQEGQLRDLESVVSQVSAGLGEFRGLQDKAQEVSVRLASEYREISSAFRRLVVCLQFHDITRQRLEHVIDALRRVSMHYRDETAGVLHESAAVAVLELQALQITDAAEKFATAVSSASASLDEIAAYVHKMAGEARALAGLSGDNRNPFFQKIEAGCGSILGSMNHCAAAQAAAIGTTGALLEIITRSRASIEDIRVIETQMQRAGIHAKASAGKLGAQGEALGTLAEAIRQKAAESRAGSDLLIETLETLSEAANRSYEQGQPAEAGETAAHHECLDRMRLAVGDLRSSHESSGQQIAEMSARGDQLSEDLAATRASFSIGARFGNLVTRTQAKLKAVIEEVRRRRRTDGTDEALESGLAEFVGQYTMQGEVEVYHGLMRALGKAVPAAAAAEETAVAPEDDIFGDNVELF